MTGDDDEAPAGYASPPCFMHEIEPAYFGLVGDALQAADVARWRRVERERLIEARLAIGSEARRNHDETISDALRAAIGDPNGLTVSATWPFRGEPDLRGVLNWVEARGGQPALPVVIEKARPLEFRVWKSGAPLTRGVWNIPVPAQGPVVVPDVILAPVVGFDAACYRLGYGGGYFDRTLAALVSRPRVVGVGYAQQQIPTIYPQPYDIAMDLIVTEAGVVSPGTVRAAGGRSGRV